MKHSASRIRAAKVVKLLQGMLDKSKADGEQDRDVRRIFSVCVKMQVRLSIALHETRGKCGKREFVLFLKLRSEGYFLA